MMEIVKASAGSGKTYTLAHKYLDILLSAREEFAYRHILAVTFTNKATAEMKSRILRDLAREAERDPRARKLLTQILHDYSAFSVSTIDKFFQQALRSFAREVNQAAVYQIELDRKSLITEAMDRVLDALTPEKEDLLAWFKANVTEQLEQGEKVSIESPLYKMGVLLSSEERKADVDAFSKERLAAVKRECRKIVDAFHKKVEAEAAAVQPQLKNKTAIAKITGYMKLKPWNVLEAPSGYLKKDCLDSNFLALFQDERFRLYRTAHTILESLYSLGLAREFYTEFDALLKEKNVMCLEESNTILKDIIDGSDAPFVYEKLGVRYKDFLLDEFQDTSLVQWDNFLPLLKESQDVGGDSLIVGDVKQSIYRFRGSEWDLLATKAPETFPLAKVRSLESNFRSSRAVVEFNNGFFSFLAGKLGKQEIYSDVQQKVRTREEQPGEVRIDFCDNKDIEAKVLESVQEAKDNGARLGDIAILVRGHAQGQKISDHLISNGVRVISDDSLSLKSSALVRRLVSLMNAVDNPQDSVSSYLASQTDMGELPQSQHSLTDLCEVLIRKLEVKPSDTLFLQAFLDDVQNWTSSNGHNLHGYLQHWKDSNLSISSPQDPDAVRVITIHQSKGLEFPYVIFPYAHEVKLFHTETRWCHLDHPMVPEVMKGNYPVDIDASAADTFFNADYQKERELQSVDNLNIFYVALTRAEKALHIISKYPSKALMKALDDGKEPDFKDFSQYLYSYVRTHGDHFGQTYDFYAMRRRELADSLVFDAEFQSIPLNPDPENLRLECSQEAKDFFGDEGVGAEASVRLAGISLHNRLAAVDTIDDLPEDGTEQTSQLRQWVSRHPEWFSDFTEVRNEVELFAADGSVHRPDRVIRKKDGTIVVVDYKFGEHKRSYERQVREYMNLYRALGESHVEGALWYVKEDCVVWL